MKVIGKILKILGILLLALVVLIAAADAAWIYVPQIKAAKRIDDVDAYAAPVEALTVREGAGIIALGEATHGNAEFQRLRRDVLEWLTEEYGVRSFALEADFGEAAGVDEYIKGGAGTAAEALNGLSFTIYHTREMEQLIEWMRAYNDGAAEGEKLSFYGFDMQNPDADLRLLSGFCAENGVLDELSAAEKLAALAEDEGAFSALCESADFDIVSAVHDELTDNAAGYDGAEGYEYALHAAECALQAAELAQAHAGDDYIKYNNIRDGFMAENVAWISARESAQGRSAILISGHDGHGGGESAVLYADGRAPERALRRRIFRHRNGLLQNALQHQQQRRDRPREPQLLLRRPAGGAGEAPWRKLLSGLCRSERGRRDVHAAALGDDDGKPRRGIYLFDEASAAVVQDGGYSDGAV